MQRTVKFIVLAATLALGTSTALFAQSGPSWAEQWYRAKFGRPSPTEQSRFNAATRPVVPQAQSLALTHARSSNAWLEQLYQVKFGRPTPRQEARLHEANLGRNAVTLSTAAPADARIENWYRAKFGRTTPQE